MQSAKHSSINIFIEFKHSLHLKHNNSRVTRYSSLYFQIVPSKYRKLLLRVPNKIPYNFPFNMPRMTKVWSSAYLALFVIDRAKVKSSLLDKAYIGLHYTSLRQAFFYFVSIILDNVKILGWERTENWTEGNRVSKKFAIERND